ncbi:hypothetical protein EDD18DRAFT_418203 [Armillaria luteobubalina]|uniref:Uncharacterized protein n=1 Tax=Armillaria luteobubalina TaxID=153913 RepID=A0AA39Q0Z6_9AGAR|nr:hypothetical protein EDD18DRAFT_418203 [Armillaria luteobubalina]
MAPQWEDPNPMTQETKKRISKIEDLCRSDPILVHRASRVLDPPLIGERARSPYQFVNVYVKETKPRNTFADMLEAMRSKAQASSEQKKQPPQGNTDQSRSTSEKSHLRSDYAAEPAELDGFENLSSETPFSYDDDSGDSELLTIIREAFSDSEPDSAAPKTPESRRRSSSCAPNTPSPAKRNIEDDEPNLDQSSFTTSKEEDLAVMFYGNPWFAFKKRNPKQVFLWDYNVNCVPFKVVKGGKVLGEWVFALDMVYRKDALYQLLMATSFHGNDPGNKMIDILRKFDAQPEVVYKKTFVTRDKGFQFTVKELWCDEEWKFNLEAKVTFSRLHSMMKTSRRVQMESELWPDWLDYLEK